MGIALYLEIIPVVHIQIVTEDFPEVSYYPETIQFF